MEPTVFTRKASGLVKELSFWDVVLFVIAAPAASGITYYAVSTANEYRGASIPLAFCIGLLLFLPISYLIGSVSASMPRAGGQYVCVSRVLGPGVGFMAAWMFFAGYATLIGILGYIVMGILGGVVEISAIRSNMHFLIGPAKWLQSVTGQTLTGVLWVLLFGYVTRSSLRSLKYVERIIFAIPLVATIIIVLLFVLTDNSRAMDLFNQAWGKDAYDKVVEAAKGEGWLKPGFSWHATFLSLLVVLWAYGSIELVNFASGEIKTPKKTLVRGFLIGCLGVGALYVAVSASVYHSFGSFINAYDFLYDRHRDVLENIMPSIQPSIPFFTTCIVHNIFMSILLTSAIALWYANTIPPLFLANSRLIFALAMDRAIPARFADVDPKTCAPTWAAYITTAFGVLGVFLNTFNVQAVLGIVVVAIFVMLCSFGLACALLPYRRPDIYELSPLKARAVGLPILTVLGVVVFLEGIAFEIIAISQLDTAASIALACTVLVGIVIFFLQRAHNKQQGIRTELIYSQIPPE